MSLRSRLLAGMAFVAVVLAAVSVFITRATRDQLIDQTDDRLADFAALDREFLGRDGPPDGVDPAGPTEPVPPFAGPERVSDAYQGFIAADGTLTTRFSPNVGDEQYGAPDVAAGDLPGTGRRFLTTESVDGDVTYRVVLQRVGDVVAVTALPIDDVQATISRLIVVEILGALLILAALGLVSWWVIRLGIRPVKEMTATATRIADGDLTVRVPETSTATESGQLAVALNRMLGHIEGALDERTRSEERLRRFVADASHELRTPVTTIRGYAELYRHGGLDDADALDDAMRRTEQEAARMSRLVEDMLALARLDEQRPVEEVAVDLAALAGDAAADARATWPDRAIHVDIDTSDVSTVVLGDEDRLRQVIANIVGNAFVHTDPDAEVTLRVGPTDDGGVELAVADTGAGMPADVAERVTERFYRADPARSRHRGGSGLGLSIVDATIAAHRGTFAVDSEPGHGTTVRFSLPRAPSPG
jgi:two-component system OmpR family sensor kinase